MSDTKRGDMGVSKATVHATVKQRFVKRRTWRRRSSEGAPPSGRERRQGCICKRLLFARLARSGGGGGSARRGRGEMGAQWAEVGRLVTRC